MALNRERSEQNRTSPARASPKPAPTETPSTFTITGIGQPCTANTDSAMSRMAVRWPPSKPSEPEDETTSAPEQKSPLAPVRTTARAFEAAISRKESRIASHIDIEHALRVPGR